MKLIELKEQTITIQLNQLNGKRDRRTTEDKIRFVRLENIIFYQPKPVDDKTAMPALLPHHFEMADFKQNKSGALDRKSCQKTVYRVALDVDRKCNGFLIEKRIVELGLNAFVYQTPSSVDRADSVENSKWRILINIPEIPRSMLPIAHDFFAALLEIPGNTEEYKTIRGKMQVVPFADPAMRSPNQQCYFGRRTNDQKIEMFYNRGDLLCSGEMWDLFRKTITERLEQEKISQKKTRIRPTTVKVVKTIALSGSELNYNSFCLALRDIFRSNPSAVAIEKAKEQISEFDKMVLRDTGSRYVHVEALTRYATHLSKQDLYQILGLAFERNFENLGTIENFKIDFGKNNAIHSAYGSGKTHFVLAEIKRSGVKSLFVTPRLSLIDDIAARAVAMGISVKCVSSASNHHKDDSGTHQLTIVCDGSLNKLKEVYPLVITDESYTCYENLANFNPNTSDLAALQRNNANCRSLAALLSTAQTTVVSDAIIHDEMLEMLTNPSLETVRKHYDPVFAPPAATLRHCKSTLDSLFANIDFEKNNWIYCDSKKTNVEIADFIMTNNPGHLVHLIDADHVDNLKLKLNDFATKKSVHIVTTKKLDVGVSVVVSKEISSEVHVVVNNETKSVNLAQACRRVRNASGISFYYADDINESMNMILADLPCMDALQRRWAKSARNHRASFENTSFVANLKSVLEFNHIVVSDEEDFASNGTETFIKESKREKKIEEETRVDALSIEDAYEYATGAKAQDVSKEEVLFWKHCPATANDADLKPSKNQPASVPNTIRFMAAAKASGKKYHFNSIPVFCNDPSLSNQSMASTFKDEVESLKRNVKICSRIDVQSEARRIMSSFLIAQIWKNSGRDHFLTPELAKETREKYLELINTIHSELDLEKPLVIDDDDVSVTKDLIDASGLGCLVLKSEFKDSNRKKIWSFTHIQNLLTFLVQRVIVRKQEETVIKNSFI